MNYSLPGYENSYFPDHSTLTTQNLFGVGSVNVNVVQIQSYVSTELLVSIIEAPIYIA